MADSIPGWDWTGGLTVARMAEQFTPQEAARIKAQSAALKLNIEPDEHIDTMMRWHPGHQWFLFCLDAVARRA
jgi:hypothetical protein